MQGMRIAIVLALCVGCGGAEAPAPAASARTPTPTANRPPALISAMLSPSVPRSGDTLSLAVNVRDPDQDAVQVEAAWYKNGALLAQGPALTLNGGSVTRGDSFYAEAYASDGKLKVSMRSATVNVRNRLPQVLALQVLPETPSAEDSLLAQARVEDSEQDPLELEYRWSINGKELRSHNAEILQPGKLKRGDEVVVGVRAHDGYDYGEWVVSAPIEVRNSAPQILSQPSYEISKDLGYSYRVKAEDPDGDRPLRYQLHQAPDGMRMDLISGEISWAVPADVNGKFPVEFSVSDSYGGERRQSYVLELRWETVPASTE